MIVDTSALVAMVYREPDWEEIFALLQAEAGSSVSAANYVEAGIVVDTSGRSAVSREFDELLSSLDLAVRPVTADQARVARSAYRTYGKGSAHRAQLNFGDCFAYALAVETGEPLLFVGDHFTHTDVRPALRR